MARFTLKSALAGVALAGTFMAVALPSPAVRADAPTPQTAVHGRAVIYHDAFSGSGGHLTDQQLGFASHWEGVVDTSNPTAPIEWTRMADAARGSVAASSSFSGGMQPAATSRSGARARPHDLSASTCNNTGGVKLWVNSNETGDCIRYTGTGSVGLTGVQYPYSSSYVNYSQSFSTYGSTGSGHLACGGGNWYYGSNTNYGNLYYASSYVCNGAAGQVYALYDGV